MMLKLFQRLVIRSNLMRRIKQLTKIHQIYHLQLDSSKKNLAFKRIIENYTKRRKQKLTIFKDNSRGRRRIDAKILWLSMSPARDERVNGLER